MNKQYYFKFPFTCFLFFFPLSRVTVDKWQAKSEIQLQVGMTINNSLLIALALEDF